MNWFQNIANRDDSSHSKRVLKKECPERNRYPENASLIRNSKKWGFCGLILKDSVKNLVNQWKLDVEKVSASGRGYLEDYASK